MNPVTFTGGARIGKSYWESMDYSWPLATLIIWQLEISLNLPFQRILLPREKVIAMTDYRGIISDGIQIQHTSENNAKFVVFWISPSKVACTLREAGYSYHESAKDGQLFRKYRVMSAMILPVFLVFVFLLLLMNESNVARDTRRAPECVWFNILSGLIFICPPEKDFAVMEGVE